MISIVVPTMWKFEPFCDFLASLVQIPTIGEIIIINNDNSKTPNHDVLKHSKVKMFDFGKNIVVNPAWNFGVKNSENEIVCILSDDVIVDLKLFLEIEKQMSPELGPFGIGLTHELFTLHNVDFSNEVSNVQKLINTGIIEYNPLGKTLDVVGSGSLFFIHKDNWIEIPEELLHHFGDNWIFDTNNIMGKPTIFINNVFFYSPWGTTSRLESVNIKNYENENLEKYRSYLARWVKTTNYLIPEDLKDY